MKIDKDILERKGTRKAEDIPAQVLELLHAGVIETVNLTEWLAIDQLRLLNRLYSKKFCMTKKLSFHPTLRYVLVLITKAIRLRACLDWNKNPSFLAYKNLSE